MKTIRHSSSMLELMRTSYMSLEQFVNIDKQDRRKPRYGSVNVTEAHIPDEHQQYCSHIFIVCQESRNI